MKIYNDCPKNESGHTKQLEGKTLVESSDRESGENKTLRITKYLLAGELDNTIAGQVKGWLRLLGVKGKVKIDLRGNFHRDIRGTKIKFVNEPWGNKKLAKDYLGALHRLQTGKAGCITAGLLPVVSTPFPYFEFHTDQNGLIVIELILSGVWAVQIINQPINQYLGKSKVFQEKGQYENL